VRKKFLHWSPLEVEEVGINLISDAEYKTDESSLRSGRIVLPTTVRPERVFTAFLDGSMRLYKIASAYYTGTPFFVASISTALLHRDKDGNLINTPYSRFIYVILFPFHSYLSYIEKTSPADYKDALVWRSDLERALKRFVWNEGCEFFDISSLQEVGILNTIFEKSGTWILSDVSFVGIMMQESGEKKRRALVREEDLFNSERVKMAARARARYLMGLLEFYSLLSYLENEPSGYVMVDGLFYSYKKVGIHFSITKEKYYKKIKQVVGFIKNPRFIPSSARVQLLNLKEGEYLTWSGYFSSLEEDDFVSFSTVCKKELEEQFQFAVLRFRLVDSNMLFTPVGVVKLQTSKDEDIAKTIEAIMYEKYPLPTDRRRLYNEPYPIEVAEKIAKTFHPPESRMKGLILQFA